MKVEPPEGRSKIVAAILIFGAFLGGGVIILARTECQFSFRPNVILISIDTLRYDHLVIASEYFGGVSRSAQRHRPAKD